MKHVRLMGLVLGFVLVLSGGCGGGGSSGAGSTAASSKSSTPAITLPSPGVPPTIPLADYTSTTSEGNLNTSDAAAFADNVFQAAQFLYATVQSQQLAEGPYVNTQTQNGQGGGTVTVTVALDLNGNGWVESNFKNYTTSDGTDTGMVVENGLLIQYFTATGNGYGMATKVGAGNFQESYDGYTYTYNGSFNLDWASRSVTVSVDMSIDSGTDAHLLLKNFTLQEVDTDINNTQISGQIYVSGLGYVSVSTPVPITLSLQAESNGFPDVFPQGQYDEVDITGADGAVLHVGSLSDLYVWLGLDTNGDGTIDEGTRLSRATGELDTAVYNGAAVEADAEIDGIGQNGGPAEFNAKFSHSTSGFVTYKWKMVATPPGSLVTASGTGAILQFQPDVTGGYTAQLTATANGKSATDFVTMNYVDPDMVTSTTPTATEFKAPAFLTGSVGQVVYLDGRASYSEASGQWVLTTPAGSTATLSNADGAVASFMPDVSGIYYAQFCASSDGQCSNVFSQYTVIEVGLAIPIRFGPPTLLGNSDALSGGILELFTGDFNGSGRDGFGIFGSAGSNRLEFDWWPAASGLPELSSPQSYTFSDTSNCASSISSDINSDVWPDLFCLTNSGGIMWLSQGSASYTENSVSFPSSEPSYFMTFGSSLGDIEGKPAAVILNGYRGTGSDLELDIDAYVFDGGPTSPTPIITTATFSMTNFLGISAIKLADINGDGKTDLIMVEELNNGTASELRVFLGNGDGTFTYSSSASLNYFNNSRTTILVGDFNDDRHADIIVQDNGDLHLFYGDGTGALTSDVVFPDECGNGNCSIADLNGNYPALVEVPPFSTSVAPDCAAIGLVLNQSDNQLGPERWYPLLGVPRDAAGCILSSMVLGDYNGDGVADLFFDYDGHFYLAPGLDPADPTLSTSASAPKTTETLPESSHNTMAFRRALRSLRVAVWQHIPVGL